MRATGGRLVTVNATGCLEVFSTPFPESAWQVPWLHSLFGNAAAVASGVAAAMRATGRDDIRVAGPGGRRRHRRHRPGLPVRDVRAQRRRAVRLLRQPGLHEHRGAAVRAPRRPAPAPPTPGPSASGIGNAFGTGKNLPRIAMAHEIPYVATATVADLHDLEAKVGARRCRGTAPATCTCWCRARSGWGSAPATPCGSPGSPPRAVCSRSSRPSTARSPGATPIRRRVPVEEYLRLQTRFKHLFAGAGRPDVVAALQAQADRDIARFGLDPEEES